jgi:hypothetical protein
MPEFYIHQYLTNGKDYGFNYGDILKSYLQTLENPTDNTIHRPYISKSTGDRFSDLYKFEIQKDKNTKRNIGTFSFSTYPITDTNYKINEHKIIPTGQLHQEDMVEEQIDDE